MNADYTKPLLHRPLVSALLLLLASAAVASPPAAYIQQARANQLAARPGWLALLHFKHESLGGDWISQADDADFFLSKAGRTDPTAELDADLQAFFQPAARGHAQCLFPARWHWLKRQLDIPGDYDVSCPKLDSWLQRVSTDSLTLVFPVMYLDNPASSFGHTFLRFDNESVLLSHALNYAAAVDQEDGFLAYAYNGLFGGYRGVFNTRLYFETVQQYSAIENRDIWEYRLDYTPDEIEQLARHVWEVTDIDFDYYFFRENCSYRLLTLLDVIRPGSELTTGDAFPFYAIPVDTVRALDEKNLVRQKQYRPSLASQLSNGFESLQAEQKDLVMRLAASDQDVDTIIQHAATDAGLAELLQLAYTLLQFRGESEGARASEISYARSRLPASKRAITFDSTRQPPEQGHNSARFALGGGRQNRQAYVDLLYRPAFHDLLDATPGYVEGSQIRVLDTRLRYFAENERLVLEQLDIISLVSLSPVSEWYTPLSWQLATGFERTRRSAVEDDMAFVTTAGAGYSTDIAGSTLFAMLMLEANVSAEYEHDYSLLAGVQLGISSSLDFARLLVLLESDEAVSGFDLDKDSASIALQYDLSINTALRAGYRQTRYQAFDDEDWFLRLQHHF